MKKPVSNIKRLSFLVLYLFLTLIATTALGQQVNVITPVSSQTFKLPDPATFQTAADVQTAITSAEAAGKALAADADAVKKDVAAGQADFSKAETSKSNYSNAVTAFDKTDVEPYKLDLDKYNAAGKKYTDALAGYNKSAQANNALPANQRKPATVAALTKQRLQVDSMGKQLVTWKTRLDAAKAKPDVKKAALDKQQLQYQAAEQGPVSRLKGDKAKLKDISDMLNSCAGYAQRCHGLLNTKFNAPVAAYSGYFSTPDYNKAISGINLQMVALQFF